MKYFCFSIFAFCFLALTGISGQRPSVSPSMIIQTETGLDSASTYTGSAPIKAFFSANPQNQGEYTAHYEWSMYEEGKSASPFLVRHDADVEYTFNQARTIYITLTTVFTHNGDTIIYAMEKPFSVTAYESTMNVPNTFTPNHDGTNDIFKVKDGHRSIVKFHGYIFNRWGKKLFEWTDINQGWDGTYAGNDVADGVYFCHIEATGADGRKFRIKKAINLIRKYITD